MLVPSLLYQAVSNIRQARKVRLFLLFDRIRSLSLSQHKSQGKDKHEEWVGINAKIWSEIMRCDESIIRRDRKFLINAGLIESDKKSQIGAKSFWYKPTREACISESFEVAISRKDDIRNMDTAVELRIIKNVKMIGLDTEKALEKLGDLFLGLRLKNKGNPLQNTTHENEMSSKIVTPEAPTSKILREVAHIKSYCVQQGCSAYSCSCSRLGYSLTYFVINARLWLEPFICDLTIRLNKIRSGRKKKGVIFSEEIEVSNDLHEAASLLYAINATYNLHFKNYSISRSESNKRVRHNIVEYPRHLRRFLYLNETEIVNVDLANSQPAILVGVMLKQGVKVEQSLINAVQRGKYYKTLSECVGSDFDYEKWKEKCLSFLYSQAKHNKTESEKGGVAKAFKTMWPIAFEWIVNRKLELNKSEKKGSSLFAIEMQKEEARWMIGKVLRRIFLFNKTICAVPMHDGCLVSKKDSAWLKRVMEEEFEKLYGFTPKIRVKERWS